MEIFGIDVGGSGIKGAVVDIEKGELVTARYRIPTPESKHPYEMAACVKDLLDYFHWEGPVGAGFPTIVDGGICKSQSNLHADWVNVNIEALFQQYTGHSFKVINDADAAAVAELTYGEAKDQVGLVMVVTIGTGLGTGVFYNGTLIPNFELGHLHYEKGVPWEFYAADSARKREELTYEAWAKRFDEYLHHLIRLFSPNLFILGGGISKKMDRFKKVFTVDVPVLPAKNLNQAGIIGAAMAAKELID